MHSRRMTCIVIAAIIAFSCSCGKKEADSQLSAEQATVDAGEIIAQGSGNAGTSRPAAISPLEEGLADPGESEWDGRDSFSPDGIPVITGEYQLSDCIELCDIDGLYVNYEMEKEPDEEDAVTYAKLLKEARPVINADAVVEAGDVVSIDLYTEEEALSRVGVSVRVGLGGEPKEIEDGLIGMSKNEEKRISVMYPEDYFYQDLNGRTIDYKIIVNSIARADEPTEMEVSTAMDYLEEETQRLNRTGLAKAASEAFLENSEIKAYPEKVIRQARSRYENKYTAGFSSLNEFLDMVGMTSAEFREIENEFVSQRAKEQLLLMALQEETGITTMSDEYRQYVAVYGVNEDDPDETLFEVIIENIKDRLETG